MEKENDSYSMLLVPPVPTDVHRLLFDKVSLFSDRG